MSEKSINKIVMEATEEIDQFIFKVMQPYCEDFTEMKMTKEDLQAALSLWVKSKDKKPERQLTITQQLDKVMSDMCDNFCKYPHMTPPEGKDEDWLSEADSPCSECPMLRL